MCLNFGSKFLARHSHCLLHTAHIASDFTCAVFTAQLLEPFLEPRMYMNSVFPIFPLVSLCLLALAYTTPYVTFCDLQNHHLKLQRRIKNHIPTLTTSFVEGKLLISIDVCCPPFYDHQIELREK